jgi:hypothetical protein
MSKVSLTVKAAADEKKLSVSCSLMNDTGVKLYVFAALWIVKDGKIVPDPHSAYASIDDQRVLHLGKIVHPLPKEKFVEQRFVPYATAVPVGQKWEQKLQFDLPVQEFNPYYLASDKTLWDEVSVNGLRVCVDWIAEVEGLKLHETPIEGAFRLEHPELLKRLARVTSDETAVKMKGLRRTDKFERFACQT